MLKNIVFILVVCTIDAQAFDWEKCQEVYKGSNNLITSSFAASDSTSSYLLSTRQCSMNAMNDGERKLFIVHNPKFI